MMISKVSIIKCPNYDRDKVYEAVSRSIELLGGISSLIKPGAKKVLVKPNLLSAQGPEIPVCTHPEVIRAVVKILKGAGLEVFIGDGPSVWGGSPENVDEVYEVCGIRQIAGDEACRVVYFDKNTWFDKFPLASILNNVDCVVSLPKFKTHNFTILTAGIKNLFGLVSAKYKTSLHRDFFDVNSFSSTLVDIYEKVRPALTIIDAITAMEGDGPGTTGKAKHVGLVLASEDAVAIDSLLSQIMGIAPLKVPTNRIAAERDLGRISIDEIECLGENLNTIDVSPFKLAGASIVNKIPTPIADILKGYIKFRPLILNKECNRCLKCIKSCPKEVISFNKEKNRVEIDYSKCIACFCCQETCPYAAIATKKSVFAKLLGI